MKSAIIRALDSDLMMVLTLGLGAGFIAWAVPHLDDVEPRPQVDPAYVAEVQSSVPVEELTSVIIYGDSRGAFLGEGASLVPGWSPVTNAAREGCAFVGQEIIWRQYGADAVPSERSVSVQTDGTTMDCNTRTYITGNEPHHDIAIVYAGTLLTVNMGTSADDLYSPVEGFMSPDTVGQWSYLTHDLTETLSRINADVIVVLSTPISTSTWDGLEQPYWDDPDRLTAVNSALFTASNRAGAIYMSDFAKWVEAQPESCQPDGSHFAIECARDAGIWIKENLS